MSSKSDKVVSSLLKVIVAEFLVIAGIILVFYILFALYRYFTFDGNCGRLIESGQMPCSIEYAVFSEPIYVILILGLYLLWFLAPLLAITTIILTFIKYKRLS